ncbi:MAG: universal stress protein [Rhodoblastus sp.]
MYKNILVPIDAEGLSDRALQHAIGLSGALGAQLTLMTVAEPVYADVTRADEIREAFEGGDAATEHANKLLESASEKLRAAKIPFETAVYCGDKPWEGIAMAAGDHHCDLIVMASRGGKHLDGFVFGSVAASVLTRSQIPLLVVKDSDASD